MGPGAGLDVSKKIQNLYRHRDVRPACILVTVATELSGVPEWVLVGE